jgi:hypothetical protein
MTLLYEAAKKVHSQDGGLGTAALNPTPGLKRRDPDLFKRIVWKPDPNEPDKGVFVATDMDSRSQQLQRELPPGILITGSSLAVPVKQIPLTSQTVPKQTGSMGQPQGNQDFNLLNHANLNQPPQLPNMAQMSNQTSDLSNQPVSYLVSSCLALVANDVQLELIRPLTT